MGCFVYTDTLGQKSMDAFWQHVLRNSSDKYANKTQRCQKPRFRMFL